MGDQKNPHVLKVNELEVFEEAKIRKLYVEQLEHPSFSASGDARVLETADKNFCSLVHRPGRQNGDPAKIRALRPGLGIKIAPYDKLLEIRTALSNKAGLHFRIFDSAKQEFKQLEGGSGLKIEENGNALKLSAEFVAKSCAKDENSHTLVDACGRIKNICGKNGLMIGSEDDKVVLETRELLGGAGISISKTNSSYVIKQSKILSEYKGADDALSLLDVEHNRLKRLCFPSTHFEIQEIGFSYKITPKNLITSAPINTNGVSLIHDLNIKALIAGRHCKLRSNDRQVVIDVIRSEPADDIFSVLRSDTISIEKNENTIAINVPDLEPIQNAGSGVELLDGKKMRSLRGRGCTITNVGDCIELTIDKQLTNAASNEGCILRNSKLKSILARDNLSMEVTNDNLILSCPFQFPSSGESTATKTNAGICFMGIRCTGGSKLISRGGVLDIVTETIRSAPLQQGSVCMVTSARTIRPILAGNGINLSTTGECVSISATGIQQYANGSQIYDENSGKLKTIRVRGDNLSVTSDGQSIFLKNSYQLENCDGDGKCILDQYNVKRLSVSYDLEVEDRGKCIHISARPLANRVKELEDIVTELQEKVKRLSEIESFVAKFVTPPAGTNPAT